MIHIIGDYEGATQTLDGLTLISFACDQTDLTESLARLEGEEVVLEIKKHNHKRSLSANGYFWKLCSLIAQHLHTDKDTIYFMMLQKYGVFVDIECSLAAVEHVKAQFKYCEELKEDFLGGNTVYTVRGYIGSSSYDTFEMSKLIDGVVNECKDLGIDTWPQSEVDRLIKEWEECTTNTKQKKQ